MRMCRARVAVCFLVSALCYGVLMPLCLYDLPYSLYFQMNAKTQDVYGYQVMKLNEERLTSSRNYFANKTAELNFPISRLDGSSSDIYMAVPIITVNRKLGNEDFGYVLQSASAMDKFIKSPEFAGSTFVFICNVDKHPEEHNHAQFLKPYFHYIERYGSSSFTTVELTFGNNTLYRETHHDRKHLKETFDYTFCLKAANLVNPKYILMMQDDAVPHKDLPSVLKHALDHQLTDERDSDGTLREFAYLKLYFPEFWQGYFDGHIQTIDLISIALIGGGLGTLLQVLVSQGQKYRVRILVFFLGSFYLTLTVLLIGRQNVNEVRRISKYLYQIKPAPECCIPAQLYPSKFVEPLSAYLTSDSSFLPVDIIMPLFFNKLKIPAYQLDPNLFYHIGYRTSLSGSFRNPKDFLFHISTR